MPLPLAPHAAEVGPEGKVEAQSLLLCEQGDRCPARSSNDLEDSEGRLWSRRAAAGFTAAAFTLVLLAFVAPWSASTLQLRRTARGSEDSSSFLPTNAAELATSVQDLFYTQEMLTSTEPEVTFHKRSGQWLVHFNGEVYGREDGGGVRGLAGWNYYYEAGQSGADAMRIWGVDGRTPGLLATCKKMGLKLSIGIDLPRDPGLYLGKHCNFVNNSAYWTWKMATISQDVAKFKSSPELLWWTVGNELETFVDWATGSRCLWERVEWVAKRVKAIDQRHPVGTVLAGNHPNKVGLIAEYCTSLDFLGLNVYGGVAYGLGDALVAEGWDKPYAITEYGPPGSWDVPQTPWGANVEPMTSTEKKRWLTQTYRWCREDVTCVGSFAFLWGWKFEKTASWFGMFNEWGPAGGSYQHGISNDVVDDLVFEWTHKVRDKPAPSISSVTVLAGGEAVVPEVGFTALQGTKVQVDIQADNFDDGNANKVLWLVTPEDFSTLNGNEVEQPEQPDWNKVISCARPGAPSAGLRALVDTSKLMLGAYRLYAFVRQVVPSDPVGCRPVTAGDPCWYGIQWVRNKGFKEHPEWYPDLTESSSDSEIQNHLFKDHNHACGAPCTEVGFAKEASLSLPFLVLNATSDEATFSCENVRAPQECFFKVQKQVLQSRQTGVASGPVSGTLPDGPFSHFQSLFARHNLGCPQPCPVAVNMADSGQCDSSTTPAAAADSMFASSGREAMQKSVAGSSSLDSSTGPATDSMLANGEGEVRQEPVAGPASPDSLTAHAADPMLARGEPEATRRR